MHALLLILTALLFLPTPLDAQPELVIHVGKGQPVYVRFNEDGSQIIVSGHDAIVLYYYDTATMDYLGWESVYNLPQVVATPQPELENVDHTLSYSRHSPDGTLYMRWNTDGGVKIWRVADSQLLRERPPDERLMEMSGDVYTSWTPDSTRIVACIPYNPPPTCIVEDVVTGDRIAEFSVGEVGGGVPTFSPDGRYFPAWNGLYDARTFGIVQMFPEAPHDMSGTIPVWSPDSRRIAFASYYVPNVRIYDLDSAQVVHEMETDSRRSGERRAAWSPDSTRLVTWDDDGLIIVWDATTGEEIARSTEHVPFDRVAFTTDEEMLAASDKHGNIFIYDTTRDEPRQYIEGSGVALAELAWQPHGQLLAARLDIKPYYNPNIEGFGTVFIWNSTTGELAGTVEYSLPLVDLVWHPDGSMLVSTDGRTVLVWDAATYRLHETPAPLEGYQIFSLSWSPTEEFLVADNLVGSHGLSAYQVWDAETFEQLSGRLYFGWGERVTWTPDDQQLLSARWICETYSPDTNCGISIRILFDHADPPSETEVNFDSAPEAVFLTIRRPPAVDWMWGIHGRYLLIEDPVSVEIWRIDGTNAEKIITGADDEIRAEFPGRFSPPADSQVIETLSPSGKFVFSLWGGRLSVRRAADIPPTPTIVAPTPTRPILFVTNAPSR